ncbi:MAG: ElyC/SanA/YdcF family protein [Bacteroidota bacterium]
MVSELLSKLDGPKELLLITSAYHLPRSLACFKKAGVKVDAFAAEPIAEERRFNPYTLLLPTLDAIGIWQTLIREWVGFVAYWFAGYV